MPKFKKKPVEIEAMHFAEVRDGSVIASWCGGTNELSPNLIQIKTLEGTMAASLGDWVILVFIVIFFVGNEALAGGMPRLPRIAELSSPRPLINIAIVDSTKNIDLLLPGARLTATPSKVAPFLPVFGAGALTFLAGMLAGKYIYDRSDRRSGWRNVVLRICAFAVIGLGSFSFVFGFPWAAFF